MCQTIMLMIFFSSIDHNTLCEDIEVVDRGQWLARDPKTPVTKIDTPLSYVVIHHSEFEACTDLESCSLAARIIQDFHMDFRGTYILSRAIPIIHL